MCEIEEKRPNGHESIVYQIYGEMLNHVGVNNAISAKELSAKFGITERKLREYVSEMRRSNELEKLVMSCNAEKKAGHDGQVKIKVGELYNEICEPFASASESGQGVNNG